MPSNSTNEERQPEESAEVAVDSVHLSQNSFPFII
jgi:hypothetical protein